LKTPGIKEGDAVTIPAYPWYAIATGDEIEQGDILEDCPIFLPPWDAPEFSAAREASKAATWDFDGWRPVRNALLRGYVILGGTVFA
jgi:hypothetical protein